MTQANYVLGHIPGAVLTDWKKDINHSLSRYFDQRTMRISCKDLD
jgi:3-mercaptopyruvate sulfurtransferase SseA